MLTKENGALAIYQKEKCMIQLSEYILPYKMCKMTLLLNTEDAPTGSKQ